ncbi:hypothetical protein [Candidatus Symbiopectobacterium sp. 'North America']|uniref:hypothetical protein n=1 Tax=Candidatus Symbiopectobacterium sp. 'North America' TaxID=2794574 RepID=UPI0018CA960B|nr:hypothetical protein [Candidatus Symbiopectobacterium sp. 'North America']
MPFESENAKRDTTARIFYASFAFYEKMLHLFCFSKPSAGAAFYYEFSMLNG